MSDTPVPGDYVRLHGFSGAYIPAKPCGMLVHQASRRDYPYGIIFDDDVRFRKSGDKPGKPVIGFSLSCFELVHGGIRLADSPWIADVANACWTCGDGDHYSEGCPDG